MMIRRIEQVIIMERYVFLWFPRKLHVVGSLEGWPSNVREGETLTFDDEMIKELERKGSIRRVNIRESYTLKDSLHHIFRGWKKGRRMSFVTVERDTRTEQAVVSFIWDDEVPSLYSLTWEKIHQVSLKEFLEFLDEKSIA